MYRCNSVRLVSNDEWDRRLPFFLVEEEDRRNKPQCPVSYGRDSIDFCLSNGTALIFVRQSFTIEVVVEPDFICFQDGER